MVLVLARLSNPAAAMVAVAVVGAAMVLVVDVAWRRRLLLRKRVTVESNE
jgi:hypothetical protein